MEDVLIICEHTDFPGSRLSVRHSYQNKGSLLYELKGFVAANMTLLLCPGGVCCGGHLQGLLRAHVPLAGQPHQPLSRPHQAPGRLLHRHPRYGGFRDLRGNYRLLSLMSWVVERRNITKK